MPSSSLTFHMTRKEFMEMKLMRLRKCWDRDGEMAPRLRKCLRPR